MSNKKKIFQISIVFLILSLFFRIDFRFKTTVECCSDDYDYFSHAQTIALDYDFDYSNQIPEFHPYFYKNKNKITPVGYPGSGLLASPFLFLGNYIDTTLSSFVGEDILNYGLLFYSLAPIFYYFIGANALIDSLLLLKLKFSKYKLLILISGSGISYFAFERFSMTHIYEFFIISVLIKYCIIFYKNNTKISSIIIPPIIMISFLVRMSNLYVFLIPLIIKNLVQIKFRLFNKLIKNFYFVISSFLTLLVYLFISNKIYGKIIFNPQEVYGSNVSVNSFINSSDSFILLINTAVKDSLNVLFGNEFGLAWVSPIIFSGLILTIYNLKNLKNWGNILILICFAQNFFVVLVWRSTGASYGFRYLYSLVPLCIIIYYFYKDTAKNLIFYKYIYFISIFSNIAIIFFETSEQTSLSMDEVKNSFGIIRRYSEPNYVTGVIKSLFHPESYLIIITTSFVGVVLFKIILILFDKFMFINFLTILNLPTNNSDFLNYIEVLEELALHKIILIAMFLFTISHGVVSRKYSKIKI